MKNHKIKRLKAALWYKSEASLGEGPLWIPNTEELLWVDINKGLVHATNATTKEDKIIYKGKKPSCIVPVSVEQFLIADANKIVLLNAKTKKSNEFISVEFNTPNVRFNDGKADPNGNMWVGTMEMNIVPNKGKLYLVDGKKTVLQKLDCVSISNGLTWSIDEKTMYYIDTVDRAVYAFDFNENSEISNRRIAIEIPEELGYPDGMTIDNKGNLWVAMWGGNSVICFNPKSGEIIKKVEVDAPHVTSCTFGGKNMDTLFITTARDGLSETMLKKYPLSGSLFYIKSEVKGVKMNYFKLN